MGRAVVDAVSYDANTKFVCDRRCGWHGVRSALLSAPDPFNEGESLSACPKCRDISDLEIACDEPGCWEPVSCGFPSPDGYRQTCGKHYQARPLLRQPK